MLRFNSGQQGGQGFGRGGRGSCFRDGSCRGQRFGQAQGFGQGLRKSQSGDGQLQGTFRRFFGGAGQVGASSLSGIDWIRSAIDDLQKQIDALRNQSGK